MLPIFPVVFLLTLTSLSSPVSAADIAILKSAELPSYEQAILGFKGGLPATIKVKEYSLGGQVTRGREIGQKLRGSSPDLVFAVGLKAAMAAKLEILDTPVVFCLVLNPETHGLPAPNMIGIAVRTTPDTQLAALRAVIPNGRRIGVLYDEEQSGDFVREAHRVATQQGLELSAVAIHGPEDVPEAVRRLLPKIDALWLIQDQAVVSESAIPFFLKSTLRAKIPLFTFSSTLVQQGAVGALVVDAWAVGQQAARLALSRLNDSRMPTGSLHPPEHPQLALNLNSAEFLGLAPTPEVMRLAGQLFDGPEAMAQKPGSFEMTP